MSAFQTFLAETPGKDASVFIWAAFITGKYANIFLKATWVTLYVAVLGTLLGYLLGFLVGVINTTKPGPEDNLAKRVLLRLLRGIVWLYVEVFRDTPMIVQGMVVYYGLRQNGIMIALPRPVFW